MYFVCDYCGKYVDDGCPQDNICLECIDNNATEKIIIIEDEACHFWGENEKQQGN